MMKKILIVLMMSALVSSCATNTKKAEEMRSAYSDFIAKKSPAYTKNINEASKLLFSFLANKKEDNKNQSLCIDAANCIPAEQIEK